MASLVIFGAGGHANSVFDVVAGYKGVRADELKVTLDSKYITPGLCLQSVPVIDYENLGQEDSFLYHVAIGENFLREIIFRRFKSRFARASLMDPVVHSSAVVSPSARIGLGSYVGAFAYVGPNVEIGIGCVVNTSAVVEHDCQLGDFSSLAPGAVIGGNVFLGKRSFIGLGSLVKDSTLIEHDVVIGSGSNVLSSIRSSVLVYGSPAKIIRDRSKSELVFK
ncbi:NeuD/PglB/VioB family sugar acetyltransferase [Synechococcus sp. KORDI-49]|uniref:NeuD/PglB/VioB family sugar acetyltransferase n=1 Tax=Synechococcus sp. KORDI-49 TaxID=585423 RepID=UPI0008FFA339|nr:NeuD/PglB/VioB family sugar acetyltransferase [Synechococcus sp. KORDI-49]